MTEEENLCPFSKPIIGKWCQCPHAKLAELCSGKMSCTRAVEFKVSCDELDHVFKTNTRFILGVTSEESDLTHAQLMKIRCGGMSGMQRILQQDNQQAANVRDIIDITIKTFGSIDKFPFNEIVQDIKNFKHRK